MGKVKGPKTLQALQKRRQALLREMLRPEPFAQGGKAAVERFLSTDR